MCVLVCSYNANSTGIAIIVRQGRLLATPGFQRGIIRITRMASRSRMG